MKHCVWIFLVLTISSYSQTPGNGVTDIDGNQYNSVIIGTQEWQKENLNVSKYSDGTPIPQVTDPTAWANLTIGAWCYYDNDTANGTTYGKLYNWYAVAGIHDSDPSTPNKVLAPEGWHVPSDAEWTTLINYLDPNADGGSIQNMAGGMMKEVGITHWLSPNVAATNSSGFSGLPGGLRYYLDMIVPDMIGNSAYWWSSSENDTTQALYRVCICNSNGIFSNFSSMNNGFSLRLLNNTLLNNQLIKSNSFNIYPNPAKDYIYIDITNLTDTNGWSYKIVNTLGQEVLKGVLSSQQNIIQLSNIKGQGIYFVKIYDSSNKLMDTKKIIIQK